MARTRPDPGPAPIPQAWRHPHDAFREALSLYYAASVRPGTMDTGRLLLRLWAYVEGMIEATPYAEQFTERWNELQAEWQKRGSASGVGSGMTPDEFEAHQLVIIVRHAKLAGIFEAPSTDFSRQQLEREIAKHREAGR